MSRPTVATIHCAALQHNLSIIRRLAPASRIWSVVKANGYGHGLQRIFPGLAGSDGFALLNLEEAILLRELGWEKPVLLLEGFFRADELKILDHYRLTTCVHSQWQIEALGAATLSAPLNVYVKLNCGMNRLGFAPQQFRQAWQQLRQLDNIAEMTVMSHFACADMPDGIGEAMQIIAHTTDNIQGARSLANSAATLWHPHTHTDWIRPGIILYGASPNGRWQDIADFDFRPAMTLSSEIIAIQDLEAGKGVGYGQRFLASEPMRVGIVACGYADGYPRHAPGGTPVMVDGIRTRIVGTVSMDMLMVDLTSCPGAKIGSAVELWGDRIKIDEVAEAAGTVGYELMCALAPRVQVDVV